MQSTPQKVLLTGGAGFLGSHVTGLLLARGYEVVVLDDFSNGKMEHLAAYQGNPKLKIMRGDITIRKDVDAAIAGCQTVIHLAVLCLRQSIQNSFRVTDVIVNGTLNCLMAAMDNGIELFLNCSSSEVFGTAMYTPMDEDHPFHPETPYAAAKVAQDMFVRSYGATFGLNWTTIRPFNMYGPNSHWQYHRGELIPKMIVRAMNKVPLVIFGDGMQSRDFVYVEDAAKALVAVLEAPSTRAQCINVCTGRDTTVRHVAELICAYFKLDPEAFIQYQPDRPGDVRRHVGAVGRFRELLGFAPEVQIEDGLVRTIRWLESLPLTPAELLSQEVIRNWEITTGRPMPAMTD